MRNPAKQTQARKRDTLNIVKKFRAAATIALIGVVAAGCHKPRDRATSQAATSGGLAVTITNKTVSGQHPNLVQNGGEYTFLITVTRNGATLSPSDYTAAWSSDNNLLDVVKNSDNSCKVRAKSINSSTPVPVTVVVTSGGNVATDQAHVTIGNSGNNNGNFAILLDQTQRTVQINTSSIITVSVNQNGQTTQLQSNQYNLELRDNPNNIGGVSVVNNSQWQFLASSNIGTADLFVNVFNFNGQSGQATFSDAITTSTTGGGGGSSSGVLGPTITSITVNTPANTATPGQPLPLTMSATKDGNSTADPTDVNWWMTTAQLMNEMASVDANGRVYFRLAGASVQVMAWGKGNQQSFDGEERWAKATRSASVTVASNNTTPNGLILVRVPAHLMVGMRWEAKMWNCNAGTFVFPGGGGASISTSDANVLAVQTSGTKWFLEPKKPGFVTLNLSGGGLTGSFTVRVLPYFPQVQEHNGEWVIDTHANFGPPHENPSNSAERVVPCVVNIDRISLRGGFPSNGDLYEMLFTGGAAGLNGTTPPVLSLQHVDPLTNTRYAVMYFRYLTDSGTENVSNWQYAEGTAPVQDADFNNSSKWRWPQFKAYSRWWGGSGNDNFKVSFTRANPNTNPLDFRVIQN